MKSKAEIVLKALMHGLQVIINGSEYVLDDDNELCVQMRIYSTLPGATTAEERQLGHQQLKTEYTLSQFISLCNRLSDDDAFIISSETALNDMKRTTYS